MMVGRKTKRKADRSNSQAGRIMPTSNNQHVETQPNTLRKDTQLDIEHHFHGVSSSKIRFNQTDKAQSHASTDGIASAARILEEHLTWTPLSQARQKASAMASSPLSIHHSSEFATPSRSKSTPKGRDGNMAHGHPLSTNAELAKAPQGPSERNTNQVPEESGPIETPRARADAEQALHAASFTRSDTQARTYNGQRSILKDINSPKHKRPSADALRTRSVTKRVKLNAPSSRGSDGASEEPLNTSTYFVSTAADVPDSGRQPKPRQKSNPKAPVASKSSSKSRTTRRGSYTGVAPRTFNTLHY
jgi:hypothetical protein